MIFFFQLGIFWLLLSAKTVLTQGLVESLSYFTVSLIPIKYIIKNMIQRTNVSSSFLFCILYLIWNPTPSLKSFYPFTSSANRLVNYTRQFTCLDSENKWNYCYFCIKRSAVNPKEGPLFVSGLEGFSCTVLLRLLQLSLIYSRTVGWKRNCLVQVTVKKNN